MIRRSLGSASRRCLSALLSRLASGPAAGETEVLRQLPEVGEGAGATGGAIRVVLDCVEGLVRLRRELVELGLELRRSVEVADSPDHVAHDRDDLLDALL